MARRQDGPETPGVNPYLEGHLRALGPAGLVLDLGCGRGDWMARMRKEGLTPVGIEPEQDRAKLALAFAPAAVADGQLLPFRDASIAVVWCIHVLHHLENPVAALAEIRRVLQPGGHLILAETVEDNPVIRLGRRLHPEWDGVHVHSRFTAAALLDLLGDAGLHVIDQRQHSFVSFAAWLLPMGARRTWMAVRRLEDLLPRSAARWGAHLECVARAG
ncbi:MAG TPA: class I SAM-dependent methyltransferase [Acidimicrobiales bacterium]|nr:class I SAM-dependent methyltransferase [Acidimicrobiales bacterium]